MNQQKTLLTTKTEKCDSRRRRRSADDRLGHAPYTPISSPLKDPFIPGAWPQDSQPSDDDHDIFATPRQSFTSSISRLSEVSDDEAPVTPVRHRSVQCEVAVTDQTVLESTPLPRRTPGRPELPQPNSTSTIRSHLTMPVQSRTRAASMHEVPINSVARDKSPLGSPKHQSPCGKKEYVYRKPLTTHIGKCKACQTIQSQQMKNRTTPAGDGSEKTEDNARSHESQEIASPLASRGRHKDIDGDGSDSLSAKEEVQRISAQLMHANLITLTAEHLTGGEGGGFIYILRDFKSKANGNNDSPSLFKVGYSTGPMKRGKQIEKCGITVDCVHVSNKVISMKRAEKLIKADLHHLCQPYKCEICPKRHKEWFLVKQADAIASVNRWANWVNREPYQWNEKTRKFELRKLWEYLIAYGRAPTTALDHDDHDARWAHWDYVLGPPAQSDHEKFRKYSEPQNRRPGHESERHEIPRRVGQTDEKLHVVVQIHNVPLGTS